MDFKNWDVRLPSHSDGWQTRNLEKALSFLYCRSRLLGRPWRRRTYRILQDGLSLYSRVETLLEVYR
jgi:hypothetical protein